VEGVGPFVVSMQVSIRGLREGNGDCGGRRGCLACKDSPGSKPADADVDDIRDALPGMTFPLAAADAVGKVGHLVEHGVDLWHDILTVNDNGRPSRSAEGRVQDSALFRDIDLLATEHRIAPCT